MTAIRVRGVFQRRRHTPKMEGAGLDRPLAGASDVRSREAVARLMARIEMSVFGHP